MSERRKQRGVVLAIILVGYLLALIDVSILMAALPSIRADLGFSDTSLSWAQNDSSRAENPVESLPSGRAGFPTRFRELSRRAPTVLRVTLLQTTNAASETDALDDIAVRELNAVVGILESLAVRLAPRFDGPRRAGLRAANGRLRAARNPVEAAIADRDVHRRLVEPYDDDVLRGALRPAQATLRALRVEAGPGDAQRHAAEHDVVIDALAAGDNDRAADRLRAHVAARLPGLLAAVASRTDRGPHRT